jgi:hypothetical protein
MGMGGWLHDSEKVPIVDVAAVKGCSERIHCIGCSTIIMAVIASIFTQCGREISNCPTGL